MTERKRTGAETMNRDSDCGGVRKPALIFDLDGTLWDTRKPVVTTWNRVFEEAGFRPGLTFELLTSLMGKPMDVFGAAVFPELDPAVREPLIRAAERAENRDLLFSEKSCLYPGAADVIRDLSRDYWIGIASNCQSGYIETFLTVSGLQDAVDDCISHGDTGLGKADNIRILMERNGLDEAWYAGDTAGDMVSAENAGISFVWCRYGFARDVAADGIDDPVQLRGYLERHC